MTKGGACWAEERKSASLFLLPQRKLRSSKAHCTHCALCASNFQPQLNFSRLFFFFWFLDFTCHVLYAIHYGMVCKVMCGKLPYGMLRYAMLRLHSLHLTQLCLWWYETANISSKSVAKKGGFRWKKKNCETFFKKLRRVIKNSRKM